MPTPGEVHATAGRWILTVILGFAALVAVITVIINLGHKADVNNLQHQGVMASVSASVNQNSQQYNQGRLDALTAAWQQMNSDMSAEAQVPDSAKPQVKAAVLGDGNTVCYDYTQVNQHIMPVAGDITSWAKTNCSGPAVSQSSQLRK